MSNDASPKDKPVKMHECTGAVSDSILGDLEQNRSFRESVSRALKSYDEAMLEARAAGTGRDPRMQESIEAMDTLLDTFRPTHEAWGNRGEVYQVLDTSVLTETSCAITRSNLSGLTWAVGVRYRDSSGRQFTTSRELFESRYKPCTHYSQSIHKEAIMEAMPWVPRGADRRIQQRGFTSAEKRSQGERRKSHDGHEVYFLAALGLGQVWTEQLREMANRAAISFEGAERRVKQLLCDAADEHEQMRELERECVSLDGKLEVSRRNASALSEDNTRKGHRILDLDQQLTAASGINAKLRAEVREVTNQKDAHWAAYVGADAMMRSARERETTAHANLKHERTVVRREERLNVLRGVHQELLNRLQGATKAAENGLGDAVNFINLMIAKEH